MYNLDWFGHLILKDMEKFYFKSYRVVSLCGIYRVYYVFYFEKYSITFYFEKYSIPFYS